MDPSSQGYDQKVYGVGSDDAVCCSVQIEEVSSGR